MDPSYLIGYLIPCALYSLEFPTTDVTNLLAGTVCVESDMGKYTSQMGGGPALGIYQMEPDTYYDIWDNFLKYRVNIAQKIINSSGGEGVPKFEQLRYNTILATQMARIHYLRVKEKIPDGQDLEGLARYWKLYYNTKNGKGKEEDFIKKYLNYYG